ncbi:hypothetical protein [Reinekea sp.]|jgi:hypothetical protein|uniref:hypothetical protein n=1 Tax=Reinekea sp. TaxID=1970455 RepID=UPI002A841048|nr:hypothetical protein [Reinekea sp.]
MTAHIGIQLDTLCLAVPGEQISQINLPSDIHWQLNMPYVMVTQRRIPVLQVDARLSRVSAADPHSGANYIVSLAYAEPDGPLLTRFALQVEAVHQLGELQIRSIPAQMQRRNSPLLDIFTDAAKQHGFSTDVQALERFFNHHIEIHGYDHDYPMAG